MAATIQKKGKQQTSREPAQTQEATQDSLRAVAGPLSKHQMPLLLLVIVFVFVEALIIALMGGQFRFEWTAFMARRYVAQKHPAKAVPYYIKLVAHDPKSPTYLGELAQCYSSGGQYDKAIEFFSKAQENRNNIPEDDQGNKPEATDFNTAIGLAYYQKGDMTNAEKYLKQGLQVNKLDKIANFLMGELEFKRGQYRKAADYFKIVASDPDYKDKVREYYGKIENELFSKIQD